MFNKIKSFFGEAWLHTKDIFVRWFDYVKRDDKVEKTKYTPEYPNISNRVEEKDISTHPLPEANNTFNRPSVSNSDDFTKIFECIPMNFIIEDVLHDDMLVDVNGEGVWGVENTEIKVPDETTPFAAKYFRTHIEKGAYVRERDMIRGTGWENVICRAEHAGLSYYVRFKDDVDFVKGGKLPGLYGGDSPSGGDDSSNGFTARMMWREDGMGELYLYCMNAESEYGASVGRGFFNFIPGKWHQIEQEIILNTPGYDNGLVRIWFDKEPVIEITGVIFRNEDKVKIDGIMSNIFYGGGDSSWAPTQDEYIDYGNFSVFINK